MLIYSVSLLLFALFLSIVVVFRSQSETELLLETNALFVFGAIVSTSIAFFNLFYVGPRILSKIKESSPTSKYNALRTRRKSVQIVLRGMFIAIVSISLVFLVSAISVKMGSDLIFHKMTTILSESFFVFTFIGISSSFAAAPMSAQEVELSFDAIQDFENIASEIKPTQEPCTVWNFCLRYIINDFENTMKLHLGISESSSSNLYKPFNTISLAAIAGDNELKEKAKEWIANLGYIIMENRISDMTKTRLIIEHLEKVDKDSNLCDFQYACEKYGIEYDFSHGWKRLNKTLGKTERIALIIIPIVTLILGILPYIVPYLTNVLGFA